MEARDLRIGNLILYKGDVIPITMIGQYGIQSNTDKIIINAKFGTGDLDPIPLTKEWLLRFGLNYLQNACWELGSMRIYNLSDELTSRYRISLAGHELTILKYVHQLQNLYFALTGQELELTDNKTG